MIPISKPFIGEEEIRAATEVLKSGMIAQGPKVGELESAFPKYSDTKYAVAVNSGTAALHTALEAVGVIEGDEVITTPFTFIATANAIMMQGAKPVFADIDEDTFNINPEKIIEKITKRTKAILTVDLYGQPCEYDTINEVAHNNKLIIIEDACQAIYSEYKRRKAGSLGHIGVFSFYATKNVACGEGGMLATSNVDYAERARLFRQHGRTKMSAYDYVNFGYNYRMTDISAAILLEQLKRIDFLTKRRIANAEYLSKGLGKIKGIVVPKISEGCKHVFNQYTIRVTKDFKLKREGVLAYLNKKGIGYGIYYPKTLHLAEHIQKLGYKKGDFPVAEKLSEQVISLPVYPQLSHGQLNDIVKAFMEMEQ